MIESHGLFLRLRIVFSCERILRVEYVADVLKELGSELSSVIGQYFGRWAVVHYPTVE